MIATLAWVALAIGGLCALWLAVEQFRHRQRMAIMYIVWPITALYLGPIALWAYYGMGIGSGKKPRWKSVFLAVTHCGSGCTLGDIIAESSIAMRSFFFAGAFASYLIGDYILAYILGIVFQYLSIAPMRKHWGLPVVWAAIKADTLSLTAFEVGLFGWMALTHYLIFRPGLEPSQPAYWFMMQIGMILGFLTAYPMNWWLIKIGVKTEM